MGKAKKRILHKGNTSLHMTREAAVNKVFNYLSKPKASKIEVEELITLFGLSAEELSEAGVTYENLKALERILE